MSSTIHMLDEINKEHGKELIGYLIKQASIEERISYPAVYDVLTHEGFFSVPEDNSKVENEKISFNNLCKRLKGECDRRKFLEKIAKEIQEKYDENINSYFKNILINENDSEYSYIESFFFAVLCVANEYDFIMEEDNMLLNSEKNSDAVVDLEWTHLWYEKTFFHTFFLEVEYLRLQLFCFGLTCNKYSFLDVSDYFDVLEYRILPYVVSRVLDKYVGKEECPTPRAVYERIVRDVRKNKRFPKLNDYGYDKNKREKLWRLRIAQLPFRTLKDNKKEKDPEIFIELAQFYKDHLCGKKLNGHIQTLDAKRRKSKTIGLIINSPDLSEDSPYIELMKECIQKISKQSNEQDYNKSVIYFLRLLERAIQEEILWFEDDVRMQKKMQILLDEIKREHSSFLNQKMAEIVEKYSGIRKREYQFEIELEGISDISFADIIVIASESLTDELQERCFDEMFGRNVLKNNKSSCINELGELLLLEERYLFYVSKSVDMARINEFCIEQDLTAGEHEILEYATNEICESIDFIHMGVSDIFLSREKIIM